MTTAAPDPLDNMGQPAARYDGRAKVTGEARYASDMPVGNPAFAFLVTSAVAKGRIETLDISETAAVPGVIDVLTAENTSELRDARYSTGGGGSSTSIQRLGPDIFHDGQIVAMVVADSYEAAREGAFKVEIGYASESPAAGFDSPGTTENDAAKVSSKKAPSVGDLDAALASADIVVDAEYETPTQHHNPIELFTTTCAWSGDRLTVYESSQFVYGLRNALAERLGMDAENIRVISHYIGGAFGSRGQMTPRTGLVALAAKRLNRPVKLVATRDQGFTIATYRAETRHHVRLGARRDGKIVGYGHDGWEISSRPDSYVVAGVGDSSRLYGFGAVKTSVRVVHADRNTPGFMRSPPVVPYIFALETAVDELAVKLGMDPVELRRINDTDLEPIKGKRYSSRSLMRCYDEAARAFGWAERNAQPASMRDGDWLVGYGCATAVYPTHVGAAAARVRMRSNGDVQVQTAAHEIGTGIYTVLAQVAAERLGVPLEAVKVEVGDTELPPAPVAGGSNTTASTSSAVVKACDAIREKLLRAATAANDGPLGGKSASQVRLTSGQAVAEDGAAEPVDRLFDRLGVGAIEEYAEFVPHGVQPDAIKSLYAGKGAMTGGSETEEVMYALGAEFVEVRVHSMTREIRVPRIVGAFAGGHIVNPRTARSQYLGGMIWGIGSALHEATEIDRKRARYVNDNLAEYFIPVNADIQDVDVILVSEEDHSIIPLGVKGIGELANVGTAAAISNAVYHATGKRIRRLPIRIDDLLA